ncbi:MAG: hypothetical protein ACFB10_18015 [Salibacteraceae bacterium]
MNYYTISASDDPKTIGNYPQTEGRLAFNPTVAHSFTQVFWDEFPDFDPLFEINLSKKAQPTNFINRSPLSFGFLVDEAFLSILESHRMPPFKAYPVKVFQNEEALPYYWFHIIFDMWHYLNAEASQVNEIRKVGYKVIQSHSFGSPSDLKALKKGLNFEKGLLLKEAVFRPETKNFDLIEITDQFYIPLISERLKDALEKANMTGFGTKSFDRISVES